MNAEQLEKTIYRLQPEIVILDSDGMIVLLAKAKGSQEKSGDVSEVISWLKAGNGAIPFVMFINLENIQIFKWDSPNLAEPVCILSTNEVLTPYGLQLDSQWITKHLLGTLADSWLSDLGYHWKLEHPPGEEQIAAIGLLTLLKQGIKQPEVEIRINSKLKYIVLKYYDSQLDRL